MKPTITIEEFAKLEMRVGKVVEAVIPKWSERLIEETVDFGAEIGTKTIFSGIAKWFKPEDLIGKKYVFVVNLAERKMGEGVSQGMMIMAVSPDDVPTLIPINEAVSEGTEVR